MTRNLGAERIPSYNRRLPLDSMLVGAIHLERLQRLDAGDDPRAAHVIFQTSTIDALLDGAYEGDLTFAELAAHGDLGLGTVQQLDGEMIMVDGRFFRADASGELHELDPKTKTPFAVVVPFSPDVEFEVADPLDFDGLGRRVDALLPRSSPVAAIRLDGRFPWLQLRSVRRQEPPYRPLAEVLADQVEYELRDADGTLVGFRFPAEAEGVEVAGYRLHFVTGDRRRGGHVLDCRAATGYLAIDGSSELHLELPAGVTLPHPGASAGQHALIDRLERSKRASS